MIMNQLVHLDALLKRVEHVKRSAKVMFGYAADSECDLVVTPCVVALHSQLALSISREKLGSFVPHASESTCHSVRFA